MTDVLAGLPAHVQATIRRIWETQVAGGSERYQRTGSRAGPEGQKEISQLLQQHGILKNDPRWTAIIDHGRQLYRGVEAEAQMALRSSSGAAFVAPTDAEGPAYTEDSSFRGRMEARQRRFRVDELRSGFGKHGHWRDDAAAESGKNFLHPAALASAEARAAAGKGVDRTRTFTNMLASQAMCFNVFGPLAASDEGREIAASVLARFVRGLVAVRSIAIEYTPDADVFRDQSGPAGVDCDVLVEFDDADGTAGVLVIETKLVEPSFSLCSHRNGSERACPTTVKLGDDFSGCRYASKNRFLYWQRTVETQSLRLPLVRKAGCPFGGPSWQQWVNHTLAHVEAKRRGAARAVFAVCASTRNDELLQGGAVIEEFRRLVTDPESVAFLPLEDLLVALQETSLDRGAEWREWAAKMVTRYVLDAPAERATASAPSSLTTASRPGAVKSGHRQVVQWMATPEFRETVATYATATKGRGGVYFRPTDGDIVMIGLHDDAPHYLGLRTHDADTGHSFRARSPVPSLADAEARWLGFEKWIRGLNGSKEEERGVMLWVRRALENGLSLPELGEGWVFLHQEWRFISDDGGGKKGDVLAVHVPTARLGIVELKDDERGLPAARSQVDAYGRFWKRDAEELAPLFTELLWAQGAAYGNQAAAVASVSKDAAALFVGVATRAGGVRVKAC